MICVKAGIGGGSGTTMDDRNSKPNRRDLFRMIGLVAGGSVMYQAMTSLGYAADSQYAGPIKLQDAPRGTRVIVLGAGLAGLVCRRWNCATPVTTSRCWNSTIASAAAPGVFAAATSIPRLAARRRAAASIRGCTWISAVAHSVPTPRLPGYARRFNVALEPFVMVNYNAHVSYVRTHFGNVYKDKVSADQVKGLRSTAH